MKNSNDTTGNRTFRLEAQCLNQLRDLLVSYLISNAQLDGNGADNSADELESYLPRLKGKHSSNKTKVLRYGVLLLSRCVIRFSFLVSAPQSRQRQTCVKCIQIPCNCRRTSRGQEKVGEQNGEKLIEPFRYISSKSVFCRLVLTF